MKAVLPVYFPFTFIEPQRVDRLYNLVGEFRIFRVFEQNDIVCDEESGKKTVFDLFRQSSENSTEIALRFLAWSKGLESLDIKAVSAFFNYIDPYSDDPENIINSVIEYGVETRRKESLYEILLRHEITLFFLQLSDGQEYEINRAFKRIADGHRKLFDNLDAEAGISNDISINIDSGFRLKNMNFRLRSWLTAFFYLSEPDKIIFTDEKDAFFDLFEYCSEKNSSELKIYRAEKNPEKNAYDLPEMFSFISSDFDSSSGYIPGTVFSGIVNTGDCLFFLTEIEGLKKKILAIPGLKTDIGNEYQASSIREENLAVCLVL